MKKVIFLTGNKHKAEIAQAVFSLYALEVELNNLNIDEIQSENIEEIAVKRKKSRSKARCTAPGFYKNP
ncbi:MAG: hypothetical protein LBU87_03760 [Lactobacillales bacterium]|jgi:inosine/xanthosine triphosphate pyrophosphatase family protein|nr:hypothetical protein [Lactobacillales bacterium]